MAEPSIEVVFESRYEGNLEKHLLAERERLQKEQAWLAANPLEIHFRVDVNGIKAQVAQAREAAMGTLAKAGPATILGADGRPAQAAMKELSKVQGLLQEITTTTFDKDGKMTGEFLSQLEQIGNGYQRISRFKKGEDGNYSLLSSAEKDVRTVKQLEDGLRSINKELGREFSNAKGRGDKEGQLAALRKQKQEVDKLVEEASKGGLLGSAAFTKAENQQDRLGAKIAGMEGATFSEQEKKDRAAKRLDIDKQIKAEEARATAALKANKIEADQAERLLPNRAKYEAEINRIYQERRKIFQDSKQFFQQMDKSLLMEGRPDLANKAFNRSLNAGSQVNQSDLDLSRAMTDSQRRGQQEIQDAGAKALKGDVEFKRKQQAEYEAAMAQRLKDDVDFGQKRIREQAAKEKEARESAFRQELQDVKAQSERRIAEINREEARLRRRATSKDEREIIAAQGSSLRRDEHQQLAARYLGMEQRARSQGMVQVADTVRGKALGAGVAADREMARFEAATRKSGHALDFHSSSLLRNAASFVRWQVPMQMVMGVQRAFMAGVEGAIRVDRQFATLQTVFHGTAEEAQMLKKETIDLAVAQGRSADEAMDSSIRWSRLGMTRLQVLEATRVSLMASNVAEMTAAEAAEKLSGIYATYKLNVGDLAGVLNRLNSVSNNYNVTTKDLFNGISRVSGVAKQSGLALQDLEGIVGSVVGAGGGSGAEVGNALKTVLTRLGDPKVGEGLKKAFDIDLTGPNGDLKDMSQILRELAQLYPTLNKAEGQRLLMLAAGSRQASRFEKVMSEYRQGQVLAARAGMDHTASVRENEKILESLQSRIDGLKSSWTDLATSFGDAGLFDVAKAVLGGLQLSIRAIGEEIDRVKGKGKDTAGDRLNTAETLYVMGTIVGGNRKRKINKDGSGFQQIGDDEIRYAAKAARLNGKTEMAAALESKLDKTPEQEKFKDEISAITREVTQLQSEIGSLGQSEWVFGSLAESVEAGAISGKDINREFQKSADLLRALPGGQDGYTAALKEFYKVAESGDPKAIAAFLRKYEDAFLNLRRNKADLLSAKQPQTRAVIDERIAGLEARKAELLTRPPSVVNDDDIKETDDRLKELRAKLDQVNGQVLKVSEDAFGLKASARINNYIDDVMAAAKAFGEAFKDFAPDPEGDPVVRIMTRRRLALELGRNALEEIKNKTLAQSAQNRETASFIPDERVRQREIDKQDAADSLIKSKIQDEEERLEQLRRELEYEEAILQIKREQTDAGKEAERSSLSYRFGETDSDKDANQARFAIERAKKGLSANSFGLDPANQNRITGQVLQDEATARRLLDDMARRNYEIDAERRQIAYDTVKAMREQTEEASKRYQLASREDQLRASVLARTIRDKGPVGLNEFSMLGQNTRNALTNYLPNEAPGLLNQAKADAQRRRQELDEEQKRLRIHIHDLGGALQGLTEWITKETGKGGALDPTGGGLPARPLQDAANSRDQNPVIKLDIGSINVQIKLNEEVTGIVRNSIEPYIKQELQAMENRLRDQRIPNSQGWTE